MLRHIRLTHTSVVVTLLFCLLMLASFRSAMGAGTGMTPGVEAASASQPPSRTVFALEPFYPGTDNAMKEFGAARSDHAAIALDIAGCYKNGFGDPLHWSPTVRAILLFALDEHLMHTLAYNDLPGEGSRPVIPVLNPFHAAAISFSDRVSRDRLEFRRELEDSRVRARWYQYLILGLGAGATIVVSVRALLHGNTAISGIVGVSAIILSAAGAAVSSMNTFEGSQATVLRDQRALSQLQQLHWRIASDVLTRSELCSHPDATPGSAMDIVGAWRTRLEAILDSAVESISKPGDLGGGGLPAPVGPGAAEPARSVTAATP